MTRRLPYVALAIAALPAFAFAQDPAQVQKDLKELQERVDELEDQQSKTSERIGGRAIVQAYTASSLDFGGHVTSLFTYMHGEGDSEAGHMVTLLELFLRAQIDDQWSLFATPGFYTFNGGLLDNPATVSVPGDPTFIADDSSQAKTFLSRIYGQWKLSDALQIQGGIVGTPHGTSNREYFIPSRTIAEASLHTRYFLGNQLYPQVVDGLRASGKYTLGDTGHWLDYDAYYGALSENAGDAIYGARLGYVFGDLGLTIAANAGAGTRTGSTSPTTNFGALQSPFAGTYNVDHDFQFGGIDVDWRQGDFVSKTELYYSAEDGLKDQRALSSELTWFASPQWGLSYRFDYYDAGSDFNIFLSGVAERGTSTEHVVGVTYNPNNSVRLRLDAHHNNLPNSDDTADYVNFSWSISF
ncbi:MAG: hypothetical protein IT456_03050 [Planctomycetes bacterium]|nr:hypothetical protein [Planctomycetota bacterium]